jgi:DNA helicase-2/ATP-dependent DNA helicase PcrA
MTSAASITLKSAVTEASRQWSEQQQAIFTWFRNGRGSLVVRARAGTGKTTTILAAIDHAPEDKILLAAFNKRIADELKLKLKNPKAVAKTLHGVGYGLILRNWQLPKSNAVDEDRGFNLALQALGMDGTDGFQKKVANVVKRLSAMGKNVCPFATVDQLVAIANDYDVLPDDMEDLEERGFGVLVLAKAASAAMELAAKPNTKGAASIDFDDMIFVPLRNNWVRGVYGLVVIDEAQDMNYSQLLLAQRSCKRGGRVVVVGDDRQAIYGFRGADSGSLDRLKTELQAQEMGLTITYRCPRKVVAAAAVLVPDYRAAPTAPEGVIRTLTEDRMVADLQPLDFVLSRKNAPLVKHCLATLRAGKRARIEGRDIGRGIIALVEKMNARDLVSLEKKLADWEAKQVRRLEARMGAEKAASKVAEVADTRATITSLADGLTTVNELEQRINQLFSDAGTNQVVFSSVHKAKGLEAPRVFTIEESFNNRNQEEANIRYVALTRAQQELVYVTPKVVMA